MALRLLGILAALGVAACSTTGLDTGPTHRSVAPLRDDIAGMLLVFDLPRGLGAPSRASVLTFAATGLAPVTALLVEADADTIAASLPPPPTGHAYYFFGLAPADQGTFRTAQAMARAHATDAGASLVVTPHLCRSAGTDVSVAQISVFAALPGPTSLLPLIDHRPLAEVSGGAPLPTC